MNLTRPRTFAVAGIVALSFGTIGCASNTSDTSTVETTAPTPTSPSQSSDGNQSVGTNSEVAISDFSFQPDVITIGSGASVVWTNNDKATHTATNAKGEPFDSKRLGLGQTYSKTFTKPGTYSYKCSIHNYMTGTIVVK